MREQGIIERRLREKNPKALSKKEPKRGGCRGAGTSGFKTSSKRKNYCKIEVERLKPCGSSMVKACFYLFIYLLAAGGLCYCLHFYFFFKSELSTADAWPWNLSV